MRLDMRPVQSVCYKRVSDTIERGVLRNVCACKAIPCVRPNRIAMSAQIETARVTLLRPTAANNDVNKNVAQL